VKKKENNKTITNQIFNTIENQNRPQFLLKGVGGGKKTKTGTHFEHLGNKRNNRKRVLSRRQTESRKNKTAKKKQSKTNAVTCKRRESESLGKMRRRGRSVGRRLCVCVCEKRREEKRRGRKEGRKEGRKAQGKGDGVELWRPSKKQWTPENLFSREGGTQRDAIATH
jgi:hypothetical protein